MAYASYPDGVEFSLGEPMEEVVQSDPVLQESFEVGDEHFFDLDNLSKEDFSELFGEDDAPAPAKAQVQGSRDHYDLDKLTEEDVAELFGSSPPPAQVDRPLPLETTAAQPVNEPSAPSSKQAQNGPRGLALPPPPPKESQTKAVGLALPTNSAKVSPPLPPPSALSEPESRPEPKKRRPAQPRKRRADKATRRGKALAISAPKSQEAPAQPMSATPQRSIGQGSGQLPHHQAVTIASTHPAPHPLTVPTPVVTYNFDDISTQQDLLTLASLPDFQPQLMTPEAWLLRNELCATFNLPQIVPPIGTAENPIAVDDDMENTTMPGSTAASPVVLGDDDIEPKQGPSPPETPKKKKGNGAAVWFGPKDGSGQYKAPPRAPQGLMGQLVQNNPKLLKYEWMFDNQAK